MSAMNPAIVTTSKIVAMIFFAFSAIFSLKQKKKKNTTNLKFFFSNVIEKCKDQNVMVGNLGGVVLGFLQEWGWELMH
jgi:hypothetical protein